MKYFVAEGNNILAFEEEKNLMKYLEDLIEDGDIDLSKLTIIKGEEIWLDEVHVNSIKVL